MTMPGIEDLLERGTAPVVAILRGVRPDEVVAIGRVLVATGVRLIEVPLNSPEPIASVRLLAEALGGEALIGAGTVLSRDGVRAVADAGGRLIVTPNTDPTVIAQAVELGLEIMPGFATPSEAFTAIAAGARRLKLFPAAPLGSAYLKAVREVLPATTRVWAVGGTGKYTLAEWRNAGAEGIGIGSALYRPGDSAETVRAKAEAVVAGWREASARW